MRKYKQKSILWGGIFPRIYFISRAKNCECLSRVSLGAVIFLSVAVITISAAGRFHSLCFLYVNKFFIQYYTIWCVHAEEAVPVGGAKWHIKNKMIIPNPPSTTNNFSRDNGGQNSTGNT